MLRVLLILTFCFATAHAQAQTVARQVLRDIYCEKNQEELVFGNDAMRLRFDGETGELIAWHVAGIEASILLPDPKYPDIDVQVEGAWLVAEGGSVLLDYHVALDPQREGATLSLVRGLGKRGAGFAYTLTTHYRIFPGQKKAARSATCVRNLVPGSADEKLHFEAFRFSVPGVRLGQTSDCALHVPGPFFTNSFIQPGTPLDTLLNKDIGFHSAPDAGFGLFVVENVKLKSALAIWTQTKGEVACHPFLKSDSARINLLQDDLRAYYFPVHTEINSDVQHLEWTEGLTQALAAYRADYAQAIPIDNQTPDWVEEMVLLEVYPSYFADGFAGIARKLPFYRSVGFNTLYLMPHWQGGYFPLDPFAVNEAYGSEEDLKFLVKEAHRLGMRVLFDMVIHGFSPQSPVVASRPEMFVRKESGELALHPNWKSVTTDWASEAYRQYMVDLVLHDLNTYGIDGYRVDAATFKGAGWNPQVPYPAYRDGSAAPELMGRMLEALRQTKPEAVLLSEVFGPAFYGVCNLVHDNQTEAVQMLLEQMDAGTYTAAAYKAHMAAVYAALPPGANRVFFARNHDTSWFFHFGGYTPRFLSFDAIHVLFAIPEFFAGDPAHSPHPDDDPKVYDWYRKLFAVRASGGVFQHGEVLLDEVVSDNPMVFSGIRKLGEVHALGLISTSESRQELTLTLDLDQQFGQMQKLKDADTGASVALVSLGRNRYKVALLPYQVLTGYLVPEK